MDAKAVERAWAKHLAADISIVDSLALEFTRLDATKWTDLQKKAQAAKTGDRGPADALDAMAGKVRSRLVLERIIASAYQRVGAQDRAVEMAAKAIEVTPRWDPTSVAAVCNTIAWSLYLTKAYAAAVTWAERAVAAEPTQPYALGTLCEALGLVDPARAVSLWKFLEASGYPSSVWGDFKPAHPVSKAKARVYTVETFAKHTDEEVHRLRIANRFDTNLREFDRYHGQAVALIGTGRLRAAYAAASLARTYAQDLEKVQVKVVLDVLRPALEADFVNEATAEQGRFSHVPEDRAAAIEQLVSARDATAVEDLVFDAHYGVSMAACKGLITLGGAERHVAYLEMASVLEHKTGQSIYYGAFPKPFDLVSGAKTTKPTTTGSDLVAQAIATVKKGGKKGLSIPAPEPVPPEVLDKLVLADGVPLSPSMRAWLAFDGGWIGREYGWFKDPASPAIVPLSVAALVNEHISEVFAPSFLELPGKLAGAKALPLDCGSESMRMLALVPGPEGEYPVIYIDVDDEPMIGISAPSFDVWLASHAGLVGDVGHQYTAEIKKAGKYFIGTKDGDGYLGYTEAPDGFAGQMKEETKRATERAKALAAQWKPSGGAAKKSTPIPTLPEGKLAEALADAIEGGRETRVRAFLEDAKARFPTGRKWKDAAVAKATVANDVALVRELLALGADVNTKYYLQNRLVHCAASREDVTLLKVLIEAGADLTARGYSKQTPLHDACDDRAVNAVRVLIQHKVDLEALDEHKRTPLMEACHVFAQKMADEFPKTVAIATLLLDAGADVNARNQVTTALHEAIEQRNHALAKLLIERGADVEAKNYQKQNALLAARTSNDLKTADLLAQRGARTDQKDKRGIAVDDLTQADGLTPAVFAVKVQCSKAPQTVNLRARWVPDGAFQTTHDRCKDRLEALGALAAGGLAGSDVWPPTAGAGTTEVRVIEPTGKAPRTDGPVEMEGVTTVAGLSPAGLAMVVRGLYTVTGFQLTRLEITGDLPLDGSAISVDTARAKAWLKDPVLEPYRPWASSSVRIGEHPAPDTFGRVRASASGADAVETFLDGFKHVVKMIPPVGVKDLRDRAALMGRVTPLPRTEDGWRTLTGKAILVKSLAHLDAVTLRAAFGNGVEKLAALGALDAAEWSLGVGASAAREGLEASLEAEDTLEESPSSRATCPKCKESIEKGDVRFAEKTLTGARYYHLLCAAERLPARLQGALARYEGEVPDWAEVEAVLVRTLAKREKKAETTPSASGAGPSAATGAYPYAEVAKTGRAVCVQCTKPIAKDSVRIAVPRQVDTPQGKMIRPGYLHPACAKGFEGVTAEAVLAHTAGLDDARTKEIRTALE